MPVAYRSGGLDAPAINGSQVAFAATPETAAYGQTGMFVGSISHWRPVLLRTTRRPETEVNFTRMSNSWLSWVQSDGGMRWTLYARSLKTGRTYKVDSSGHEGEMPLNGLFFPITSLHGDTIAWSYVTCVPNCRAARVRLRSAVLVRRLPNGPVRRVAKLTGECVVWWPSVWGSLVAYDREGECWGPKHKKSSDVFLSNLKTGRTRRITTNHGSSEPATNGRFLAWKQGPPGSDRFLDGKIILENLSTGRVTTASVRMPGPHVPKCWPHDTRIQTCADEPVITADILEWTMNDGGVIMAQDLGVGRDFLVYGDTGAVGAVVIYRPRNAWGRTIVWRADTDSRKTGNRTGDEIGMATVP